jgi:hypothetical protein
MKASIAGILIQITLSLPAIAAGACADMSGKWLISGGNSSDWRDVLSISQNECKSIIYSWMEFSLTGTENRQPKMPTYPYLFAGSAKNDGSVELYEKEDLHYKHCSPFQFWILKRVDAKNLHETIRLVNCDGTINYEETRRYSLIN